MKCHCLSIGNLKEVKTISYVHRHIVLETGACIALKSNIF